MRRQWPAGLFRLCFPRPRIFNPLPVCPVNTGPPRAGLSFAPCARLTAAGPEPPCLVARPPPVPACLDGPRCPLRRLASLCLGVTSPWMSYARRRPPRCLGLPAAVPRCLGPPAVPARLARGRSACPPCGPPCPPGTGPPARGRRSRPPARCPPAPRPPVPASTPYPPRSANSDRGFTITPSAPKFFSRRPRPGVANPANRENGFRRAFGIHDCTVLISANLRRLKLLISARHSRSGTFGNL